MNKSLKQSFDLLNKPIILEPEDYEALASKEERSSFGVIDLHHQKVDQFARAYHNQIEGGLVGYSVDQEGGIDSSLTFWKFFAEMLMKELYPNAFMILNEEDLNKRGRPKKWNLQTSLTLIIEVLEIINEHHQKSKPVTEFRACELIMIRNTESKKLFSIKNRENWAKSVHRQFQKARYGKFFEMVISVGGEACKDTGSQLEYLKGIKAKFDQKEPSSS